MWGQEGCLAGFQAALELFWEMREQPQPGLAVQPGRVGQAGPCCLLRKGRPARRFWWRMAARPQSWQVFRLRQAHRPWGELLSFRGPVILASSSFAVWAESAAVFSC